MRKTTDVPSIVIQDRMYVFGLDPYVIEYDTGIRAIYVVDDVFDGFLELNPEAPLKSFNPEAIASSLPEYMEFITIAADAESNAALVDLLYGAGLCESDEYVTEGELRMITSAQVQNVFKNDETIESLDALSYCTNIGKLVDNAFDKMTNLESIYIPESVWKIGSSVFSGCINLTHVTVDSNNAKYTDFDSNAIYEISTKKLIAGCEGTTIYPEARIIGKGAFYGSSIDEVIIPDSVQEIENLAFSQCAYLESVYIGSGVTNIGDEAFSYCSIIGSIEVDEANVVYNSGDGANGIIDTLSYTLIQGCVNTDLEDDGITAIGNYAFKGQTAITEITIPENITSIGDQAFHSCISLVTVNMESETPPALGDEAFYNVGSGFEIVVPVGCGDTYKAASGWSEYADDIKEQTPPVRADVTATFNITSTGSQNIISSNSSAYLSRISRMSVDGVELDSPSKTYNFTTTGEHVVKIQFTNVATTTNTNYLFHGLTTLVKARFGEGLTHLGTYMFYNCSNLQSYNIPASVTNIDSYCCYNTSSLNKIIIDNMNNYCYCVSATWGNGFWYAQHIYSDETTEITSIVVPEGVTSLGRDQFNGLISVTNITLPSTLTSTGPNCFKDLTITEMILPASITTIDRESFNECSSLATLYVLRATPPTLGSGGLNSLPNNFKVYVLPESVDTYKAASNWSSYSSHIYPLYDDVTLSASFNVPQTRSSQYATRLTGAGKSSYLDYMVIDNTTHILHGQADPSLEVYDFLTYGDHTVDYVLTDDSTINTYMFNECDKMTSLKISNNVTTLEDSAITRTGITSIDIPNSVAYIGDRALSDNASLEEVTIGTGIESIGESAFESIPATTITIMATEPPTMTDTFNDSIVTEVYVPSASITYYESAIDNPNIDVEPMIEWDVEATFNITSTGSQNILSSSLSSPSDITFISIDGKTLPSVTKTHDFTTTGQHTVKYKLANSIIPSYCFYSISQITKIVLNEGITIIKSNAFGYCTGLTTITMPSTLTATESNAFGNNNSLAKVIIPDIAAWCSATLPSNPIWFAHRIYSDENTEITDLIIPSTITAISGDNFVNCTSITSVTIPSTITSIGNYAFWKCSNLASVYIMNTTPPTIGNTNVFSENKSGRKFYVPNESVDLYKAQTGWSNYADYIYPAWNIEATLNVTSTSSPVNILGTGLSSTSSVSAMYVDAQKLDEVTKTYTFSTTGTHKVYYNVPSGNLASYFFQGMTQMTKVFLLEGITTINTNTFSNNTGLTTISFPSSFTTSSRDAYQNTNNITKVILTDIASWCGVTCTSNAIWIAHHIYSDENTEIINLEIPSSVTSINADTFVYASYISSVTIPSTVTSIGSAAFWKCNNLESVYCYATTPPTLGSNNVFSENKSGRKFYVPAASVELYKAASGWSSLASSIFPIPELGLTNTFTTGAPTRAMTKILNNTDNVGKMTVDGTALGSVTQQYNFTEAGQHEVEYYLNDPKTISDEMFKECSALTYITMEDSITYVNAYAFNGCSGLQRVDFSPNTYKLEAYSFASTSLPSVDIPDSTAYIGKGTFSSNALLGYISIGSGISEIGDDAFKDVAQSVDAGAYIDIKATQVPHTSASAFQDTTVAQIRVPADVLEEYSQDQVWGSTGATIEELPPEPVGDEWTVEVKLSGTGNTSRGLFSDPQGNAVSAMNIDGEDVEVQTSYVFGDYSEHVVKFMLTDPSTIQLELFVPLMSGQGVKSIVIGNTVETIEEGAFTAEYEGASQSTYVEDGIVIPSSVSAIGNRAFKNVGTPFMWIGKSIAYIGDEALNGVEQLFIRAATPPEIDTDTFTEGTTIWCVPQSESLYTTAFGSIVGGVNSDSGDFEISITGDGEVPTMNTGMSAHVTGVRIENLGPQYNSNVVVYDVPETLTLDQASVRIHFYLENPFYLPDSMFAELSSITAATLKEVHYIGQESFANCPNLEYLNFESSQTEYDFGITIGSSAFQNSPLNYESINTFPFGLSRIESSAFRNCTGLSIITLNESLSYIGPAAFKGCSNMADIYVLELNNPSEFIPTLGANAFDNQAQGRTIWTYWTDELKAAPGWSNYASSIEEYQYEDDEGGEMI